MASVVVLLLAAVITSGIMVSGPGAAMAGRLVSGTSAVTGTSASTGVLISAAVTVAPVLLNRVSLDYLGLGRDGS